MSKKQLIVIAFVMILCDSIGTFILGAPVIFKWAGRFAAPIFLYCMVDGWILVKDKKKYLKALYIGSVGVAFLNFLLQTFVSSASVAVSENLFATLFATVLLVGIYEYLKENPENEIKVWAIYWAWQIGGVLVYCVLTEIVGVPNTILTLIFTLCGNLFLAEGSSLLVFLGFIMYIGYNCKPILKFGYCAIAFIYFISAATGFFGFVISLTGSDVLMVVAEIMTGLSMYGTWVTADFNLEHLLFHDYEWMIIGVLPLLLMSKSSKRRNCAEISTVEYAMGAAYPAIMYFVWIIGNFILN